MGAAAGVWPRSLAALKGRRWPAFSIIDDGEEPKGGGAGGSSLVAGRRAISDYIGGGRSKRERNGSGGGVWARPARGHGLTWAQL